MTQVAPDTFRPHGVAGRSGHTDPLPPFASVVCLVDRSPAGHAARQQAAALATEGAEEMIATPRPGRGSSALLDRCDGADLLVLGASDEAIDLIQHTSLPVLLARSCTAGAKVTDRMLPVRTGAVAYAHRRPSSRSSPPGACTALCAASRSRPHIEHSSAPAGTRSPQPGHVGASWPCRARLNKRIAEPRFDG